MNDLVKVGFGAVAGATLLAGAYLWQESRQGPVNQVPQSQHVNPSAEAARKAQK